MCTRRLPMALTILHALRLHQHARTRLSRAWLARWGLADAAGAIGALSDLLSDGRNLAPPGSHGQWPHETALLEALARVDRDPVEAETLLAFMHPDQRIRALATLSELTRGLNRRLRRRPRWAVSTPPGEDSATAGFCARSERPLPG